jgi:hypothetical protein
MAYESYRAALLVEPFDELNVERILDEYYHSGIPYVFQENAGAHGIFTRRIANEISSAYELRCHPRHVVVCGSAHLGFSAAPNDKLGTSFDADTSDIDVAVVHPELFDRWWLELVDPQVQLGHLRAQIADDLFNGLINPQNVHRFTKTGEKWWKLFGGLTHGQLKNRVRGRMYRSDWFMQNYHRLSIVRGREKLRRARV